MDSQTAIEAGGDIVVVDDTPEIVKVLAEMLRARGYRVRAIADGQRALGAARQDPPDLVLLDINMPKMNGYDVCKELKADPVLSSIPVIFLSANSEVFDKVKAFSVGAVDYIR